MSRKNYSVDEVIRSLSKKNVVITTIAPITKTVNRTEFNSKEFLEERFQKYLVKHAIAVSADGLLLGMEEAGVKWALKFQHEHPELFAGKQVKETVVVQPPFTVNISQANQLGNGSWGKIDFLTRHQGFHVMK